MNPIDRRTASVLCTIVGFAAMLALIYQARQPLICFVFAILFAYLLDPLVSRFQKCLADRADWRLPQPIYYLALPW